MSTNKRLPFISTSSGFCPCYSPSSFTNPPSIEHGFTLKQERKRRMDATHFMKFAAKALNLPYTTICVAITYFHRFYQRVSIRVHDPYDVGITCLFSAGKQCLTLVRLDLCAKCLFENKYKNTHRTDNFNKNNISSVNELCKKLVIIELLITQLNYFDYLITLPFDYLLPIMTQWKQLYVASNETNMKTLKIYCKIAWHFVFESFNVPLMTVMPPSHIALASVELSLRYFHSLPTKQDIHSENNRNNNTQNEEEYRWIKPPLHWFKIFDQTMNEEEVFLLAEEILNASNLNNIGKCDDSKQKHIDVHALYVWRKGMLAMDARHSILIENLKKKCQNENENDNKNDGNHDDDDDGSDGGNENNNNKVLPNSETKSPTSPATICQSPMYHSLTKNNNNNTQDMSNNNTQNPIYTKMLIQRPIYFDN